MTMKSKFTIDQIGIISKYTPHPKTKGAYAVEKLNGFNKGKTFTMPMDDYPRRLKFAWSREITEEEVTIKLAEKSDVVSLWIKQQK